MDNRENMVLIGWYGGSYEDAGLFNTKEDAERGINSSRKLHEIFNQYEGKKIKIIVEVIRE